MAFLGFDKEKLVQSFGQEDLWKRAGQPTPVFLPGESHGQRILGCYSPWGCKESDTNEQLSLHNIPLYIWNVTSPLSMHLLKDIWVAFLS